MKRFSFPAILSMALSMAFFITSCNSGEEKKTTDTTVDTTAKTMAPTTPILMNLLVIMHKVANFDKWKPLYESHDSIRRAHGLTNYVIGRGMDDSNMVLVALKMDDITKAKELVNSQEMKDRMKNGGVIGVPTFEYIQHTQNDTSKQALTTRVRVSFKVKDWDTWKKNFDSDKQARMDAGLMDRAVGHSIDDNHIVSLVLLISDMAKAKAFMNSKELKDKMDKGGVEGPPTFFYYNVAQIY